MVQVDVSDCHNGVNVSQSLVVELSLAMTALSRVTLCICLNVDWFVVFCSKFVDDVIDTQVTDTVMDVVQHSFSLPDRQTDGK